MVSLSLGCITHMRCLDVVSCAKMDELIVSQFGEADT